MICDFLKVFYIFQSSVQWMLCTEYTFHCSTFANDLHGKGKEGLAPLESFFHLTDKKLHYNTEIIYMYQLPSLLK